MASSQSARKLPKKTEQPNEGKAVVFPTYTTRSGVLLFLKPIPSILLYQLNMKQEAKKPQIPMRKVSIRGQLVNEPDITDKTYQAALAQWQQQGQYETMMALIKLGIANDPPEDYSTPLQDAVPDMSLSDMRVTWVFSILQEDEFSDLLEAIMAQTMITEEGLKQAANTFPGAD